MPARQTMIALLGLAYASALSVGSLVLPCTRLRLMTSGAHAVMCTAGDKMDALEDLPTIELLDASSGRVLPCFMAASIEQDGGIYAALCPNNVPISLAEIDNERLVPIDGESSEMVAAAAEECRKVDIELLDTPIVLTARGPGLQNFDPELPEEEEEDDDGEEALILAEFEFEDSMVYVVQTLDPLYVVGKQSADGGWSVPSDAEIEAVSPIVEELVLDLEEPLELDVDESL